jgi:serine/threonine protein kinase/tetratricopeptide (TPR) repeat protein
MLLPAGGRLGPYEIISALGVGGMGEVYRVRDTRLERDVALKVLTAPMASDPERLERFAREARAVASLNHPHIVTIHSTEEVDGVRFLTMELIEGQGLERLIAKGALPMPQFFDIAVPLVDAVRAAHEKNVTHRDLKPANVMIDDEGRVKVLDFGLARFTRVDDALDETRLNLTADGTIVGTTPYMSPEQIEGKLVDHRCDLFSLAVVLYEMLSGVRPFTGDSSAGIMSSILRDVARPVQRLRTDVPVAVADVIARCLEKQPDNRVQTARELRDVLKTAKNLFESTSVAGDLRRPAAPHVPVVESNGTWIAVLPFVCHTSDADAEALAEGLTEEITTGLSRFSHLSVLARDTAQALGGGAMDARIAAKLAGAHYVLEGRVRKAGTSVRINAHLIDMRSGAHLWSETYNADLRVSDQFVIQDDVTDRVVATVADAHGVLVRAMALAIRDTPAGELHSRDLTLRYWGYHQHHRPEEHAILRAAFESVVGRQPDAADAWASLAHLYVHEHGFGFNPQADPLGRAERAARRATDIDAASQLAWDALATTYFFKHDREGFLHALDRAISINPRNTDTAAWMATLLTHMGEYERGCAITRRAMALNPHHPGWYHFAFFHLHYARREFAEALAAAKRINMPDHVWAPYAIALAAGQLGRSQEAAAALALFSRLAPELARNEYALRAATGRWKWTEADVDRDLEGFRKAQALGAPAAGDVAGPSTPDSV